MGCYIMFFGTKLWVAFGNQTGILGSGDCELIAVIHHSAIFHIAYRNPKGLDD